MGSLRMVGAAGAEPLEKRAWEVFCGAATGFSGGEPGRGAGERGEAGGEAGGEGAVRVDAGAAGGECADGFGGGAQADIE